MTVSLSHGAPISLDAGTVAGRSTRYEVAMRADEFTDLGLGIA